MTFLKIIMGVFMKFTFPFCLILVIANSLFLSGCSVVAAGCDGMTLGAATGVCGKIGDDQGTMFHNDSD
jgi:hypothetical protein